MIDHRKKARAAGRKKKIRWTPELFIEKVLKPLASGVTLNEIARNLKITRQTVNIRLQAYSIQNKADAMQLVIKAAQEGMTLEEALIAHAPSAI